MDRVSQLLEIYRSLSEELDGLELGFSGFVCNPLDYAWDAFSAFMRMGIRDGQKLLFVGMNPGPYGMMQTGVPFGDPEMVRSYLGLDVPISIPSTNPPLKPIIGPSSTRREVSGRKFWSMAAAYGDPDRFFGTAAVISFCPLAFIDGRRNVTPEELSVEDRGKVIGICQGYLERILDAIAIPRCIALGAFAAKRLKAAGVADAVCFPHPSPRNPSSSAFWDSGRALMELRRLADEA